MSKAVVQRTIRVQEDILADIKRIAEDTHQSDNRVIETALKVYRDYYYMDEKATIINEEVYSMLKGLLGVTENRINNKTNQVLSATAIELGTLTQLIADSLGASPEKLAMFRQNSVDFIKTNQRILKLSEVMD